MRIVSGEKMEPTGFCIQPLATRIQRADRLEPIAVRKVTARCWRLVSRSHPRKNKPMNVDSRKKAIRPSMANGAPKMSPT